MCRNVCPNVCPNVSECVGMCRNVSSSEPSEPSGRYEPCLNIVDTTRKVDKPAERASSRETVWDIVGRVRFVWREYVGAESL
ncbi:hypothetical protein P3T76_016311 [Phytophthora citrophthora]|uniref:Uncharacterized protein n=1 Tax=Phytophthora citrophthora TaxID=4793 RepID=A0AAD9FXR7_9STRA|nr:hypothetical protein P3T76_016376 [Phytophthora citrophthora]KAK1928188.1 hypothetical protein P3T76_016340 [Phytophthora citrophthora]KAK1928208.1 hypothetical protein P3T76_016338 [Phytophthora citrophthora]KAK1928212.1 hypothetical protein P3T76_016306 [Phytophthora citrophthora]KAK1928217.1 hypothetical protein P3T76_016311 [Phytophthora citrophthora]